MEWQPIETAPKDGTWLLLFEACEFEPQHYVAKWGAPQWQEGPDTWVTEALGPNPDNYCVDDATHWMPLPEPPV